MTGDTLLSFVPQQNEPPPSAYATLDLRNGHPVLAFDGATDEEAVFSGVLPQAYAGGGITVQLAVLTASVTSGTSRWQAAFENMDGQDLDSDSFASFQSAAGAAVSPSGQIILVTIAFSAGSQVDGIAAGSRFRLKVRRDADGTSGTDDITTDMQLVAIHLMET